MPVIVTKRVNLLKFSGYEEYERARKVVFTLTNCEGNM